MKLLTQRFIRFSLIIVIIILVATMMISCLSPVDQAAGPEKSIDGRPEESGPVKGPETGNDTAPVESETVRETVFNIYIDRSIPFGMWVLVNKLLRESILSFEGISYQIVFDRSKADISFDLGPFDGEGQKLAEPYYYTPVVSYFSMLEEVSFEDLESIWKGRSAAVEGINGEEVPVTLIILEDDATTLRKLLGTESPERVRTVEPHEFDEAIANEENMMALIPFDLIQPGLKVLKLDGQSVLDRDLKSMEYGLSVGIEVTYSGSFDEMGFRGKMEDLFYTDVFTNRRSGEMVSIMMTGVTAMTRQVASRMDSNGILYPAEKITGVLIDADFTHISNEVPFVEDCYAAKPNTMVFCSKPEYMGLLKHIDTDVVELTGNHIKDYGVEWLEYTLDMYDAEDIPYFGGGRNLEEALSPATFDIKGYKFAFIGANTFGPSSSWATEDAAGSAPINTLDKESKEADMQKYEEIIRELVQQDYNVIFTFQYLETYNYSPTSQQVEDFERISDAGAVIVSGSQAHQPQGIEIREGRFINYGLGNLFFGQALGLPVKQGIIAKHIFYEGRYINTILITTVIDDFSQPRPAEGAERADLLEAVFGASIRETVQEQ